MGLNALPNFFKEKESLVVSAGKQSTMVIDANLIHGTLARHDIGIESINQNKTTAQINLLENEKLPLAKKLLLAELGCDFSIQQEKIPSMPLWLKKMGLQPIKLGLDLSGGVLFVLDVDGDKAFIERLQHIQQSVKSLAREDKLRGVKVNLVENSKVLAETKSANHTKIIVSEIQKQFPKLSIQYIAENRIEFSYSSTEQAKFHQEIMAQSLSTMRGRIEELGITEAVVQRQGHDRIRIELPGASKPDEVRPIIGATASLKFYEMQNQGGKLFKSEDGEYVSVNPMPVFSGKHIKNAQAGRDEMGLPLVNLTLDSIGGDKMLKFSAKNIGKPMVTVFSEYYQNNHGETVKKEKVISVATIQTQLGARFSITNLSSSEKAQELALLLRAGSLDAPITIAKQRTINATLGDKNIENGMAALSLGIGITLLFMVCWYRKLGLIANAALSLNLVCLLGLMSLLPGAVLTLPGIAGFVLTVGMAVDTNVLIFERIKEEKKKGRPLPLAIEHGYKNAFTTIFDANITTLITALILYSIGYGPVKGFAVTLGLSVLTSMFTGVFISKALTNLFYGKHDKRLPTGVES